MTQRVGRGACGRVAPVWAGVCLGGLLTAGCEGVQSALAPGGRDAEDIARLTGWMTAGALAIWVAVIAIALIVTRVGVRHRQRTETALIVGGGVAVPVVLLSILLTAGLAPLPRLLAPGPDVGLSIDIAGQQWWWRVRYVRPGEPPIELANELRLPVGHRMNLVLTSRDVIHSFWLPSIAGKLDMIPGRVNRLSLEPTRVGTYRGACAEFCGLSHARMNFDVVVMEPAAFDQWLDGQAAPAAPLTSAEAERGREAFLAQGCAVCHTIRGTGARGVVGPDLTHVGSRLHIAAGLLPATPVEFERWIGHTQTLKPGALMPAFPSLPPDVLQSLGAYLAGLE